jgi:ATP-dependent RNA helicase DDX24/MAK5
MRSNKGKTGRGKLDKPGVGADGNAFPSERPARAGGGGGGGGEAAADDESINLTELMQPIQYHATICDQVRLLGELLCMCTCVRAHASFFSCWRTHALPVRSWCDVRRPPCAARQFRSWKPLRFDSKSLGNKCDFTGMLSIATIDGDEAEELLRSLGKAGEVGSKKEKKTKKKLDTRQSDQVEAAAQCHAPSGVAKQPAAKKKSKKKAAANTPQQPGRSGADGKAEASEKKKKRPRDEQAGEGCEEEASVASSAGAGAAAGERPRKKNKTQQERKEEKRQRLERQAQRKAAAPAEAEGEEGGEGVEGAAHAAARDEDFDDEFEYEEWGGIMLRKCLAKALHVQGFTTPTPIQEAVLPAATAKRRDIFGAAETGSGKTLAFALPMLQRILESGSFNCDRSGPGMEARQLSGLVLSPTRELALQVKEHIKAAARFTRIKVMALVGGLAVQKQQRLLQQRPHIVVGTPGRLWEQMRLGDEYLTSLHMLLCVVIDEADRMLEAGHFEELESILRALPTVDPNSKRRKQIREDNGEESEEEPVQGITSFMSTKSSEPSGTQRHYRRQTLVFSATLIRDFQWRKKANKDAKKGGKQGKGAKGKGAHDKTGKGKQVDESKLDSAGLRKQSVERLMDQLDLPEEPFIIDLSPHGKVSEKIEQLRVECLALDKEVHIYRFLMRHFSAREGKGGGEEGGRVIVFVNAIGEARRLANLLSCLRIKTMLLHSGLQQRQRLKHLDSFKSTQQSVMVCTDIAARGLDIAAVQVVLHYHVPKVPSVYVHRCGRTARGTVLEGKSILFVSPQEQFHLAKISDVIGAEILLWSEEGPFLEEARKRVTVARKLEAEMNKMGKGARDKSWMKQQAQEMEMDLSDDEADEAEANANTATSKRVAQLQEQLNRLLDSHLLPKGVSPRFVTGSHHSTAGLPEILGYGAAGGSLRQADSGGGYGQRRRLKPGKRGKKKK